MKTHQVKGNIVLGAGITGLAAGWKLKAPIYESSATPGGICTSYYVTPGGDGSRLDRAPSDGSACRFELGGGRWIFGLDREVKNFIQAFSPSKRYHRRAAVYFPRKRLYVPYPLQNNLRFLDKTVARRAIREMHPRSGQDNCTMRQWLKQRFGPTLCDLFFLPFHDAYTAHLSGKIAPQDAYKTPVNSAYVEQGIRKEVPQVGYNKAFHYPREGMGHLATRISDKCTVHYQKRAVRVDVKKRRIHFSDGEVVSYGKVYSTVPLDKMVEMSGLKVAAPADPYSSVLTLNIGATKGSRCPDSHWLYLPKSVSGFYRIGFYSNVDKSFLSRGLKENGVSMYVERAYRGGSRPSAESIRRYAASVVAELRRWGFIKDVLILDPAWIETAYTWSRPGSCWRDCAIELLQRHGIRQIGRYGRWKFCGIAESIRDGLSAGVVTKRRYGP